MSCSSLIPSRDRLCMSLKHSTYILMSCADTRERKERDARAGKVVSRGSRLFGKQEVLQKGGARKRYGDLISQNELPFACDIVDEMLAQAYSCTDADAMHDAMERIVGTAVARKTGISLGLPASWRATWRESSRMPGTGSLRVGSKAPTA